VPAKSFHDLPLSPSTCEDGDFLKERFKYKPVPLSSPLKQVFVFLLAVDIAKTLAKATFPRFSFLFFPIKFVFPSPGDRKD